MEFGQTRWEGRAAEPLDLIATEVENLQIHQVLEAVDFGDSIVLQVQKYLCGGRKVHTIIKLCLTYSTGV